MRAAGLAGLLIAAASMFVVEGCSSDGGEANRDEATGMNCSDLDQAACEAQDDCVALRATVEGPDGPTDEELPFVACAVGDRSCTGIETCAWDGEDGPTLHFRSGCIPDGWVLTDCGGGYTEYP